MPPLKKVEYDPYDNILSLGTGGAPFAALSIADTLNIVVETGYKGDHDVVGICIMGASTHLSPYFILEKGGEHRYLPGENPIASYDKGTDTLLFGTATSDPEMTSLAGEYIEVYWQRDEPLEPLGVALKAASKNLSGIFRPVC